MIVINQQSVQQEQLTDGVDDVDRFDGKIGSNQVVAVQFAAHDATDLGDEVFDPHETASSIVALRQQVAVHLVDDVADCFLADLEVGRLGADVGGVHQRAEVDAGAPVEEAPDLARDV